MILRQLLKQSCELWWLITENVWHQNKVSARKTSVFQPILVMIPACMKRFQMQL